SQPDVGLGLVSVELPGREDVGAWLVLELRRLDRLAVEERRVGPVVVALRALGPELVLTVFLDFERDVEPRAGPLRLKEEDVLRPEEILRDRDLPFQRPCVRERGLDLDLPRVALRQPRRAIRRLRLIG